MHFDNSVIPDAYEWKLLELIAKSEAAASELLERSRVEYESDNTALETYVHHMTELSHAQAYMRALTEYRLFTAHKSKEKS